MLCEIVHHECKIQERQIAIEGFLNHQEIERVLLHVTHV